MVYLGNCGKCETKNRFGQIISDVFRLALYSEHYTEHTQLTIDFAPTLSQTMINEHQPSILSE